MKVDVVICTRDEQNIRPILMDTLRSAKWVNCIIVEKSKPLSTARVIGARKASTPVILYVDDDVDIPKNLPYLFVPYLEDPSVLAVSSQAYDVDKHWLAYRRALYTVWKDHHAIKGNFDNRAYIIRRSVMLNYDPEPCFYCEDAALNKYVQSLGKWVNLPYCGINHYAHYSGHAYYGYNAWKLHLYKHHYSPLTNFLGQMVISFMSFLFTLDPKTLFKNTEWNVQKFAGCLMAIMDGY